MSSSILENSVPRPLAYYSAIYSAENLNLFDEQRIAFEWILKMSFFCLKLLTFPLKLSQNQRIYILWNTDIDLISLLWTTMNDRLDFYHCFSNSNELFSLLFCLKKDFQTIFISLDNRLSRILAKSLTLLTNFSKISNWLEAKVSNFQSFLANFCKSRLKY